MSEPGDVSVNQPLTAWVGSPMGLPRARVARPGSWIGAIAVEEGDQ